MKDRAKERLLVLISALEANDTKRKKLLEQDLRIYRAIKQIVNESKLIIDNEN